MNTSFEDQIRERAYQIWLAGGMNDGMAHEHWVSAEQAVIGEIAKPAAVETVKGAGATAGKPTKARKASAKTIAKKADVANASRAKAVAATH